MTEGTKKRIQSYQNALPFAKQKISMVAMILLIALIVAATTTYAWVTLSISPEVTGMQTTMASNGSLEIGLAAADGSQPQEFDIDEAAGFNTDIVSSNLRWGNLINLMDSSYGMHRIFLRPASLNTANIMYKPLEGVQYRLDGRIDGTIDKFTYTKYDEENDAFTVNLDERGVRAISSYYSTRLETTDQLAESLKKAMSDAHATVDTEYAKVEGKFGALTGLLTTYAQDKVNQTSYKPDSESNSPKQFAVNDINQMMTLYQAMYSAMKKQCDVYVAIANYQRFAVAGKDYVPVTWDDIVANYLRYNTESADNKSTDGVISLVKLKEFYTDITALQRDLEHLETYVAEERALYWSEGGDANYQIANMVSRLIDYGTMLIQKDGSSESFPITEIQSHAIDFLGTTSATATVTNGILKRFEVNAVDAGRLQGTKTLMTIAIKAKKIFTVTCTINCKVKTNASGNSYSKLQITTVSDTELPDTDSVAQDTYGLAVDFWVRCNAESTCLTLEGATAKDEDGNILRFDGVNRIWGSTGNAALTTDSTTQGGGSCYVYYADNPSDMYQSLSLLNNVRVAFVQTSTGHLLSEAKMDTENYYAVNGRITVPLVIDTNSGDQVTYEYQLEDSSIVSAGAITDLLIDVPKDITAIVYLNGNKVTNSDVLAQSSIDGRLNIQFGSSEELKTVGDEDLFLATRYVTAAVTETQLDYDEAMATGNEDLLKTGVTLYVEGTVPRTVSAFFVREINSAQGQKDEDLVFTKQSDGVYTCTHKFKLPGTYYLRYVRLDGVDYEIADPPKVVVKGFTIQSVSWSEPGDKSTVRTVDSSYQVRVNIGYVTSNQNLMPKTVRAVFRDQNDPTREVSFEMKPGDGNIWTGTATFANSGNYVLSEVVQNGVWRGFTEAGFRKELEIYLGLRVKVSANGGALAEGFDPDHGIYYRDVIVQIVDKNGVALPEKSGDNVRLYYTGDSVDTNLTWNEDRLYYTGTLQLSKAGRYSFRCVTVDGSVLTIAIESPDYVLRLNNPPTYDPDVDSLYGGSAVQFSPGTNDAVLGPVGFKYSSSASVSALVYNPSAPGTATDKYFYITQANEGSTTPGTMYYSSTYGGWMINLPTYEGADGKRTQAGTWSLFAVKMWDCIDSSENEVTSEKPLVFTARDTPDSVVGAGTKVVTDLSKHTTVVSCSVNVTMHSGNLTVGSTSVPFMTAQKLSSSGMYVTIQDDAGRNIPKEKIANSEVDGYSVKLHLSYDSSCTSDPSTYGFTVEGVTRNIELSFKQDAATGRWYVDSAIEPTVRYVGEYKVSGLDVVMAGRGDTYSCAVGENGVPSAYQVRSAAPSGNDYLVTLFKGGATEFADKKFLDTIKPNTTAKVSLRYWDEVQQKYISEDHVKVAEVSNMKLVLTYDKTKSSDARYADFSFAGNSQYERVELPMVRSGENYIVNSSGVVVLPGVYNQKISLDGVEFNQGSDGTVISNITVTMVKPTVVINSVSPSERFTMNAEVEDEGVYVYDKAKLITVVNSKTNTVARVFMGAKAGTFGGLSGVDYTAPTVSMTLSNLGAAFSTAKMTFENETSPQDPTVITFTRSALTQNNVSVGTVKTEARTYDGTSYNVEIPYVIGDQTVSTIVVSDSKGTNYTLKLSAPIQIVELKTAPPSITYMESDVKELTASGMLVSSDGKSFDTVLPATTGEGIDGVFQYKYTDTATMNALAAEFAKANPPVTTTATDSNWTPGKTTTYVYLSKDITTNNVTSSGNCTKTYTFSGEFAKWQVIAARTDKVTTTTMTFKSATKAIVAWDVDGRIVNVRDPDNLTRVLPESERTITVSSTMSAKPIVAYIEKEGTTKETVEYNRYGYYNFLNGATSNEKINQTSSSSAQDAVDKAKNQVGSYDSVQTSSDLTIARQRYSAGYTSAEKAYPIQEKLNSLN